MTGEQWLGLSILLGVGLFAAFCFRQGFRVRPNDDGVPSLYSLWWLASGRQPLVPDSGGARERLRRFRRGRDGGRPAA